MINRITVQKIEASLPHGRQDSDKLLQRLSTLNWEVLTRFYGDNLPAGLAVLSEDLNDDEEQADYYERGRLIFSGSITGRQTVDGLARFSVMHPAGIEFHFYGRCGS